jgi:hypothetical protein
LKDFSAILRLAEKNVADHPLEAGFHDTLAALFFRTGRYREAIARGERAWELAADNAALSFRYILPMAYIRLNQPGRAWLPDEAQLTALLADNRDREDGGGHLPWRERVAARVLYAEAKRLLDAKKPALGDHKP